MIGVFIGEIRIGSILYFVSHKGWVAYARNTEGKLFKTKKAAIAWLTSRYEDGR